MKWLKKLYVKASNLDLKPPFFFFILRLNVQQIVIQPPF